MNPNATTSVYVTDPPGASDCDPGPSRADAAGRGTYMQSSGPYYFRSQNRNALFLLVLTPQPSASQLRGELKWKEKQTVSDQGRQNAVGQSTPTRDSGGKATASASLSAPPGRGHASSSSPRSPHSFLPGVRGAEKRKEELSELQEGALQAPRRGGGAGVETKKERKEGARSSQRRGTRARARKGHDSPGTRLHPGSSKRTGAPGLRGTPPRAEDEEAR